MNRHDTFDAERISSINQRIRETFEFAMDAIADPSILEVIPDGAQIDVRTVNMDEQTYRIVAFASEGDPGRWVAIVTGRTSGVEGSERIDGISIRRDSDVSAEAAMDAAESALRAAAERGPIALRIA